MGDSTHAEPHGGDMKKLPFLAIGLLAFALLGGPAHAADLGHALCLRMQGTRGPDSMSAEMPAMRGAAQVACWALLTTAAQLSFLCPQPYPDR